MELGEGFPWMGIYYTTIHVSKQVETNSWCGYCGKYMSKITWCKSFIIYNGSKKSCLHSMEGRAWITIFLSENDIPDFQNLTIWLTEKYFSLHAYCKFYCDPWATFSGEQNILRICSVAKHIKSTEKFGNLPLKASISPWYFFQYGLTNILKPVLCSLCPCTHVVMALSEDDVAFFLRFITLDWKYFLRMA